MKILLVEDERSLGEMLSITLASNHYTVDLATDGQVGLELAGLWKYDLVILDVHLPKLDGLSVCRKLRSQGFITPILMLTSQSSDQQITTGLDAGADDYLVKPYAIEQLLARIRALLRRGNIGTITPVLTWGFLCLDPAIAQVTYQQQVINLRPKEYTLLELFLRCPQQIFSRDAIIDRLWTMDDCPTKHAVTNLIKDLRQRLNAAGMFEELIETVYGIGYRVKTPPPQQNYHSQADIKKPQSEQTPLQQTLQKTSAEAISKGIAEIKERFKNSLEGRIKILQDANQALQKGILTSAQRTTAREESHRLAGSLGTFGYPQGSEIARKIEHLLIETNPLNGQEVISLNQLISELEQAIAPNPVLISAHPKPESMILFMSNDLKLADALYLEAIAHGFELEMVEAPNLHSRLQTDHVSVVLLVHNPNSENLGVLQEIKQKFSLLPMLILADRQTYTHPEILEERIQVARIGGDRYLLQPLPTTEILTIISQLITEKRSQSVQILETAKIMIMDDDPLILGFLANLLQPWGLKVICLDNPLQFWQTLTATAPDLLLLDLEMPTFNGIELCQVIRNDPQWSHLPILVITAHYEPEIIAEAFAAGCDDFVRKPIIEPELIARVLKHLQPVRYKYNNS